MKRIETIAGRAQTGGISKEGKKNLEDGERERNLRGNAAPRVEPTYPSEPSSRQQTNETRSLEQPDSPTTCFWGRDGSISTSSSTALKSPCLPE